MHQRETILNSIVAILVAASTAAEGRVFRARADDLDPATDLPAINIWQGEDPTQLNDQHYSKRHDFEVTIQLCVKNTRTPTGDSTEVSIETALNNLAEELERALEADFTLGGTCLKFDDNGAGKPDIRNNDREYAVMPYSITVLYRTLRTDPAVQV